MNKTKLLEIAQALDLGSIDDKKARTLLLGLLGVGGSAIKPPLGLIPKKFHDERVKIKRFNEVRGAIARYYDAGMKINIEWIEEYNELVECVLKLRINGK